MYAFKTLEELEAIESKLDKKVSDPKTPQGEVKDLKFDLHEVRRQLEIKRKTAFETQQEISVYGSDDYIGATAGNYSFYYGYEVTACPVKSHRNEEICDEKDCDKREWCFTADYKGKELVRWPESSFSYGEADTIERTLILGMAKFIKEQDKRW